VWNRILGDVPAEWRLAPPSRAMSECTDFLVRNRVRTVLDLGCGMGRWSMHFARAGLEVSAADFASNGIEYGSRWAASEGLSIRFRCRPVTEAAYPGERFDAAVVALVLDNIPREDMPRAIKCMKAALREGGVAFALFNPVAVCATDAADNPTAGLTRVVYTDAELVNAFAGFSVLGIRRYEAGTRGVYLELVDGPAGQAVLP
jgi:ubiquinone/menaquinone biosynthesis C-methylase UbiE